MKKNEIIITLIRFY